MTHPFRESQIILKYLVEEILSARILRGETHLEVILKVAIPEEARPDLREGILSEGERVLKGVIHPGDPRIPRVEILLGVLPKAGTRQVQRLGLKEEIPLEVERILRGVIHSQDPRIPKVGILSAVLPKAEILETTI